MEDAPDLCYAFEGGTDLNLPFFCFVLLHCTVLKQFSNAHAPAALTVGEHLMRRKRGAIVQSRPF